MGFHKKIHRMSSQGINKKVQRIAARLKSEYPFLYSEVGGKRVAEIVKETLFGKSKQGKRPLFN